MGNTTSKEAEELDSSKTFEDVLRKVALLVQIPVCSDIIMYVDSLQPILETIRGKIEHKHILEIDRNNFFDVAIAHYRQLFQAKGKIHAKPNVIFKTEGVCEDVGDGPRREFYSQFFQKCLCEQDMFVGNGRRLVPSNDDSKGNNFQFAALGVAVVEAILNGECGFPYLNEALYHYIIDDNEYEKYLRVEDIPDKDIAYIVDKILKVETREDLITAINEPEGGVIGQIGWPDKKNFEMENRNELVHFLVRWDVIYKRHQVIQQFKEGLNYMGFLDSTKSHRLLKSLFVFSKEYSVSVQYLERCFRSSLQALETETEKNKAKTYFKKFLEEIDDNQASDVFVFVTGLLNPPIKIEELKLAYQESTLPKANVCCKELQLPLGNTAYEQFKSNFILALKESKVGFDQIN